MNVQWISWTDMSSEYLSKWDILSLMLAILVDSIQTVFRPFLDDLTRRHAVDLPRTYDATSFSLIFFPV